MAASPVENCFPSERKNPRIKSRLITFFPVVERELRLAARRSSTYRLRLLTGVVGIVVLIGVLLNMRNVVSSAAAGKTIFSLLSSAALVYCIVAGAFEAAASLSEEKREGTLGLLFLTDLKSYDVVFGKLTATSLHSFYGLLALVPILGLSLLAGGVTGGELWRMSLVLVNSLFFSTAVGLRVSAASR